ncbi:MAG: LamB/YcsF family protein, partial [Cyclobacteriaceae bacterium]|nr:LamB/YcsF family protein [Cyclobacteriaceae bacterium]
MIDVNCDVGEGVNNEELLMPYISSCNIACGGHAGGLETMTNVVSLAIKHNVKIGAHPSYPDRENFGRKSMVISDEDLAITIVKQIKTLEKVVSTSERQLHHIKPHGALYNDIAKNTALANVFLDAIASYRNTCALYVPFTSEIAHEALKRNFKVVYEAFADRNYNDDHSL